MSLPQQPTPTTADPNPNRGRGERLLIALAAIVTLLCLAGIAFIVTNDDNTPAAPQVGPPAPVPAPSAAAPTVQPAPPTARDLAAAQAQERYREFLRVDDAVAQGGYTDVAAYNTVAVPPARTDRLIRATNNSQQGRRGTGNREVVSLRAISVDLTPGPGDYPTVKLQACVDLTGVDVLDLSGQSVVLPDRVDRSRAAVTMYRYEPGTEGAEAGGWYVYEATSTAEPC